MLRLSLMLLIAVVLPKAEAANVVPAQFIAKMYTEGLGRAPDQSGWSAYVEYFQSNGCGTAQLSHVGQQVYESDEFLGDYSDPDAKVIALYRGALNRDPDPGGFTSYVSQLNSGTPWTAVVSSIFSSGEFSADVAAICNSGSPNYHFGSQPPVVPTPGKQGFHGTGAQLQSLLNSTLAGGVVYLGQKAVIAIGATLVIPKDVRVATFGDPPTKSYALMARLTRTSTFNGPNVDIQSGGQLTHVWVDGQRNVLGFHKVAGGGSDNANIVTLGGISTVVADDKLSDPQGGTNFFSAGGTPGNPCGKQMVEGNLLTAYSANHGFNDNSDGLTMGCEDLTIEDNNIVDVSDIGIVLFASPLVRQHSVISNNTIVSAGISMNAPISSDPSTGNPGSSFLDYTGTLFSDNVFWTGPYTTYDFGIEAGAREYFPAANNSDGTGATYTNNTTGTLSARVGAGIAVAGMLNVTITNDNAHPLSVQLVTLPSGTPAAGCPNSKVIVEAASGHASGVYPTATFNGNFDNCI